MIIVLILLKRWVFLTYLFFLHFKVLKTNIEERRKEIETNEA